MKSILRISILSALVLGLIAVAQPAQATCSNARLVGEISNPYAYIVSPGVNTPASVKGVYWGLGGGNPTAGPGDDNGLDLSSGNADSQLDWIRSAGGLPYLAGAWSNTLVDGCVDNATTPSPKRTTVALSDTSADGRIGYFGVFCKEADSGLNYDFATFGSQTLVAIPYPHVNSSSRTSGASVSVNVRNVASSVSGGVQGDPSCAGLLRGYRTCSQVRPNAAGAPTDRASTAGWICGGEVPAGQDAAPLTVPCGPDTSVYLAHALVFEGGFESFYVSQDVRVPCDPTLSDRPSNFKLIKKPRTTPQR